MEEAVRVVAREKKLTLEVDPELEQRLRAGLVRVVSVRVLYGEIEGLRAQPYSQENEEHEQMLMEVRGVEFPLSGSGNETCMPFLPAMEPAHARHTPRVTPLQAVARDWFPGQQSGNRLQGHGGAQRALPAVSFTYACATPPTPSPYWLTFLDCC